MVRRTDGKTLRQLAAEQPNAEACCPNCRFYSPLGRGSFWPDRRGRDVWFCANCSKHKAKGRQAAEQRARA